MANEKYQRILGSLRWGSDLGSGCVQINCVVIHRVTLIGEREVPQR
jgi:hypothetical protein